MSPTVDIFLAFPDGVLAYHCDTCDQRCCKGSGLPTFPADRDALLAQHPALELVSSPMPEAIEVLSTPPSGCWFLDGTRCTLLHDGEPQMNTVHTSPRPSYCTLYPFTRLGWLGSTLVVAPTGRCPLVVEPSRGVTHAQITQLLSTVGAAGLPPLTLRAHAPNSLPLERVIRDAAAASLAEPSPVPLLAFSRLATGAFLAGNLQRLSTEEMPHALADLHRHLDIITAVIGLEPLNNRDLAAVAPLLAAWTSVLRVFNWSHLPLSQLPGALLALAAYAAHWQRERPQRAMTGGALMEMSDAMGAVCELLGTWCEPWTGAPHEELGLQPGDVPAEVLSQWSHGALPPAQLETRALQLHRLAALRTPTTQSASPQQESATPA